jgi:hypothetical protein
MISLPIIVAKNKIVVGIILVKKIVKSMDLTKGKKINLMKAKYMILQRKEEVHILVRIFKVICAIGLIEKQKRDKSYKEEISFLKLAEWLLKMESYFKVVPAGIVDF